MTLGGLQSLLYPALTGQSMLLVLAAVLLAVVVSIAYGARSARPIASYAVTTVAAREQTRRTAYLRSSDPDAPGRPRPRAPGLRSPAA
jgi:Family of unknown function (DUF6412)